MTFWRDRPVFVTGGKGFLGWHLSSRLVEAGANVICLMRDSVPGAWQAVPWEEKSYAFGDVTDQRLLERVLGEYEVQTVFHLAAQTIVGVANRNPVSTFDSNIWGTWALLEACRRSPKVKQIIVASSDKAYGEQALPYTEDMPLLATHPYDVSKACADMLARSYAKTWGLPVCVTRCANLFGGGDLNWNRLVPGTIRSVLRGERPVIRGDGKHVRDYLYVKDAAAAYMLLAERMGPEIHGEAFNFSMTSRTSVSGMMGFILSAMGSNWQPTVRNEASHEIRDQYLCCDKAWKVLGWLKEYNIITGLKETVAWYKDFLK